MLILQKWIQTDAANNKLPIEVILFTNNHLVREFKAGLQWDSPITDIISHHWLSLWMSLGIERNKNSAME